VNDISELIRQTSVLNNPGQAYFDSFLPRYKMYRKAKIRRQNILVASAVIIVACFNFVGINKSNTLDIDTAAGNMSNHHIQHGKVVVFEGTVVEAVQFIKGQIKVKTDTLSLKEYFNGDDVWGVYVPGEEKFRYYYQSLGKGRYSVFVINE